MKLSPDVSLNLIITGVLWTLVYVLIIRRGFLDRTFGMPVVALCSNISWEFTFSFIQPHPIPQLYINVIWFGFDAIILWQTIQFGPPAFARFPLFARYFYVALLLGLILNLGSTLAITQEFKDAPGRYAAFAGNLMMSVLFVFMLLERNSVSGQSMYIAIFKMLGSLSASLLFFQHYSSSILLNFLYVTISIFDCIYVVLLYLKHRENAINPWKRL